MTMSVTADIPRKKANPRTEPTVRNQSVAAAKNETMSAATIVRQADSKLRMAEFLSVLPTRISSLIRSKKTIYESTAMPIETMMPAMPDSDSAKPFVRDKTEIRLHKNAIEIVIPATMNSAINR